ncbi:Lsr2 family protein [Amycolatopsis japonica]|uniref:histone-like nucleoid-structuring protein Lsr2 n=1 Tax=Amycolatopsis japonica TaxID=208439 RepID=UPI00366D07DF
MAQQVLVSLVDDIDGGEATQTVPFVLDGVSYEIDLSDDNAQNLRDELEAYIAAARRVGGRKLTPVVRRAPVGATHADRERARAVRAWAQENGFEVSSRGRIPEEVTTAYTAAHEAPAHKRASRKKP